MGRPPICTCGTIALWERARSAQTSQMLADWYSPSHLVHGFLFYAFCGGGAPVDGRARFLVALFVEIAWEVVENTPMIIDRIARRRTAIAIPGDSVLNSLSDVAMMAVASSPRAACRCGPHRHRLLLELVPLFVIRDNLT